MKRLLALIALVTAWGIPSAQAELKAEMTFEHTSLLRFEPIRVTLTLINDTDTTLLIGATHTQQLAVGRVTLRITGPEGRLLQPANNTPIIKDLLISPGERKEVTINVLSSFDLSVTGQYTIAVEADAHGVTYRPRDMSIILVDGIELAHLSTSVPGAPERLRTYSLRYWSREQSEWLFLSVDEPQEGMNYGLFLLGNVVRVFQPSIQSDPDGNILIYHQAGADCFARTTFTAAIEGVALTGQTFHFSNGDPYPIKKPKTRK